MPRAQQAKPSSNGNCECHNIPCVGLQHTHTTESARGRIPPPAGQHTPAATATQAPEFSAARCHNAAAVTATSVPPHRPSRGGRPCDTLTADSSSYIQEQPLRPFHQETQQPETLLDACSTPLAPCWLGCQPAARPGGATSGLQHLWQTHAVTARGTVGPAGLQP